MNVKNQSQHSSGVCAVLMSDGQESMNMYNHAKSLTKGHKTTWKDFSNASC